MEAPKGLHPATKKGLLQGVRPEEIAAKCIDIYNPTLTIEDLWGSENPPTGGHLLDLVLSYYQGETVDVPLYHETADGVKARSVVRSPLSREIQESTVESYKQRIFRESISQVAAGTHWQDMLKVSMHIWLVVLALLVYLFSWQSWHSSDVVHVTSRLSLVMEVMNSWTNQEECCYCWCPDVSWCNRLKALYFIATLTIPWPCLFWLTHQHGVIMLHFNFKFAITAKHSQTHNMIIDKL